MAKSAAEATPTLVKRPRARRLNGLAMDLVVIGIIAVFDLVLWISQVRDSSFWYDELYTMHLAHQPALADVVAPSATLSEPIPPLYYVIIWVWYRVCAVVVGSPVTESLLILPSLVFMAAAVFVTGLAARELLGKGPVAWVTCLVCGTSVAWTKAGAQVRYYALYYLFAAIVVWLYIRLRRLTAQERTPTPRGIWGMRVALGIAMALAAFTSYAALFWLLALALVDVATVLVLHFKPSVLWPYVLAALAYCPWIAVVLLNLAHGDITRQLNSFWPATPTLKSFVPVYSSMLSSPPVSALYVFALVLVVIRCVMSHNPSLTGHSTLLLTASLVICPFLTMVLVYVYSVDLFPGGSIFVTAYFFAAWPMLCLVLGYALRSLTATARPFVTRRLALVGLAVLLSLVLSRVYTNVDAITNSIEYHTDSFKQEAAFLLSQDDTHDPDVAVYAPYRQEIIDGWVFYYVTDQGTRPGFTPVAGMNNIPVTVDKVYVCMSQGGNPPQYFYDNYTLSSRKASLQIWIFER